MKIIVDQCMCILIQNVLKDFGLFERGVLHKI
jgi:hypothetical protein